MELGQKMKDHSYLGLPVDDLRAEVATLLASIRLRSTDATDSCIGPLSEMNLVPPSFLIDDFLLEATLIGLVAPPKAGKTFWAVMMAVCIATGRPFFGYKVNGPAKVVWVAGEDLEHLPNRIHAVMEQYDFSQEERALYDENFIYFRRETRFNLSDPMLVETFLQDISALGDACSLVVFDTYAKTSGIDDENSASSTGEVFRQLERIRSAANAAVLILHHTTKGGRTSRGSSAFDASVRMLLNVDASGLVVGENNHGQTGLRIKATIGNSSFLDSNRRPVGVLKVEDRPLHDIFSLLVRLDAENPGAVNREQVASAAKEERLGARSSVYNKIKELIDKGCITEVDGGFLKPGVFE